MPFASNVSMREIAGIAGVSVSTVSLALRNSPKISTKRREIILKLVKQTGYHIDPRISELMVHLRVARADRAPSNIAFVIPELTREQVRHYPPIIGMLAGVREMGRSAGFRVDTFYLADPGMNTRRLRSILVARGIRGIIFAPFASGVAKIDFDLTGFSAATAGYSIISPRLHRACPDYLQMMDELVATATNLGHRRLGLVMTYNEGGIGHKLFTSSFLYYQSKIPRADRIPVLPKPQISPKHLGAWLKKHNPDVIISAASVYHLLREIGVRIPEDVCFASIDRSEPPVDAAGADHRYQLVGEEAFQLVLGQLHLNITGEPDPPKVMMVDSHQRAGYTLIPPNERPVRRKKSARVVKKHIHPTFLGFLH
ncbi:MAG: LacI family DNA-binding transcriptional regulator [Opitutaceae bacterium]|jgi:LacI family transcriptional regulator|nr:LacI family DNA-binding transcriptional regulator [Opitutaceae bacterium]